MSQEGVELLKQALEAFKRGDLAWFEGRIAPDVVIVQAPEVPDSKTYEGPTAMADALADWPNEWDDFRMDLLEIIDLGDDVYLTAIRHRGRGRESGIEMDSEVFYVARGRDGQLARMEAYFSRDQALLPRPRPPSGGRDRLAEAEAEVRVVGALDLAQPGQVRPVVGPPPAVQVRVDVVLVGLPGRVGAQRPPHALDPGPAGAGGGRAEVGRVLEREEHVAVDERGGARSGPVVRPAVGVQQQRARPERGRALASLDPVDHHPPAPGR